MLSRMNGDFLTCYSPNSQVNLTMINIGSAETFSLNDVPTMMGTLTIGPKNFHVFSENLSPQSIIDDVNKIFGKIFLSISAAVRKKALSEIIEINPQDFQLRKGHMAFDLLKQRIFEIVDREVKKLEIIWV